MIKPLLWTALGLVAIVGADGFVKTCVGSLEQKCDNLETCCKQEDINNVPPQPSAPTKRMCGNRYEGPRFLLIDYPWAMYGEFPWMVVVLRLPTDGSLGLDHLCEGSLIHPQVVLTTAHCVKGKDNLIVRAGEFDTQSGWELYPAQDLNVRQVIVHEQYEKRPALNDVALLILERPVNMSQPNVGLICLPEANENMDNRDCVATGWGPVIYGETTDALKRVAGLPMVPRSRCHEAFRNTNALGPRFRLHQSFVCAGGVPGKENKMCKGDEGSPLFCPSKNNPDVFVQAGIFLSGNGCNTGTPGVYTSVPHFVNWIYNTLKDQRFSLNY